MTVSLDGPAVLWTAVALAVLGLVGSAVLLPRTSRSVRGLGARLATQVVVSGLVLVLAGVVLNDQYGFYTSWSDLLGHGGAQQVSASGGAASSALGVREGGKARVGVEAAQASTLPALPDPGQRVQRFTVHGARSGLSGLVLVSLPVAYADPDQARHTYPVVEAFQGYPGTPSTWIQDIDLGGTLDAMAAAGRASPTIIVAPQVEFPEGRDTQCVDGGAGRPQVETWISEDVPRFLATRLRVRGDRASWATIGFSFGGWCAAEATMLHPDVFGSAIVLGGYFEPDFDDSYRPFTTDSVAGRRDDLVALAAKSPPSVALWVFTSKGDGLSYPSSRALFERRGPRCRSPPSSSSTPATGCRSGSRLSRRR